MGHSTKLESRFELIAQMKKDGLSRSEMSKRLGISERHVSKHVSVMNGVQQAPRKIIKKETDKNCSVCGFRFEQLMRDNNATKCEACYQYLIRKLICKTCSNPFPINAAHLSKIGRVECYTCKPSTKNLSESFPRMWLDQRWFQVFKQFDSGCLTCGSSRAMLRDGRFCSWKHDPDYLDDQEAELLLKESGLF